VGSVFWGLDGREWSRGDGLVSLALYCAHFLFCIFVHCFLLFPIVRRALLSQTGAWFFNSGRAHIFVLYTSYPIVCSRNFDFQTVEWLIIVSTYYHFVPIQQILLGILAWARIYLL
jgi:hypothetical protein